MLVTSTGGRGAGGGRWGRRRVGAGVGSRSGVWETLPAPPLAQPTPGTDHPLLALPPPPLFCYHSWTPPPRPHCARAAFAVVGGAGGLVGGEEGEG